MAIRQDWIINLPEIQQALRDHPHSFVRQFCEKLNHYLSRLDDNLSFEYQRAVIHAFQLYGVNDVLRLIANYDPSLNLREFGPNNLKKSIHSLNIISTLLPVVESSQEKEKLFGYQQQIILQLSHLLGCSPHELHLSFAWQRIIKHEDYFPDPSDSTTSRYLSERLDSLFSCGYLVYLTLRNRHFHRNLLRFSDDGDLEERIHQTLDQWNQPVDSNLAERLKLLDFRTIDRLIKNVMRHLGKPSALQKVFHSLPISEYEDNSDSEPSFSSIDKKDCTYSRSSIRILPTEEIASDVTVAKEAKNEDLFSVEVAPSIPFERDPFEELCFRYSRPLIHLAVKTKLVRHCTSPFYRPKSEEYVSESYQIFNGFFDGDNQILSVFSSFVSRLLKKLQPYNLFTPQKEQIPIYYWQDEQWQRSGMQERDREWTILFQSTLPFTLSLESAEKNQRIEAGRTIILQLGKAYFDSDILRQDRYQTSPTGYFKFLIRGGHLPKDSSVIYADHKSFYVLPYSKLKGCKGLILLFLIAIRNKYSVELPDTLKDYLVKTIPPLLDHSI